MPARRMVHPRRPIDAACRTTSAMGQNVMPSPYGRQRPRSTRASGPTRSRKAWVNRVLPTPASPTMVTMRTAGAATASRKAASRVASSASRPTSGVIPIGSARSENPGELEGADGFRLALQGQRLQFPDIHLGWEQPTGQVAQQDRPRGRRALESRRDVDRVPGDQPLPKTRIAGHHLPGIDPDRDGEADR